jgi:hypothetical protein
MSQDSIIDLGHAVARSVQDQSPALNDVFKYVRGDIDYAAEEFAAAAKKDLIK